MPTSAIGATWFWPLASLRRLRFWFLLSVIYPNERGESLLSTCVEWHLAVVASHNVRGSE